MTALDALAILAMLGAFLCCVLAAFLFVVPARNRTANVMLGAFLVLTAIDISAWFAGSYWMAHPALLVFRVFCSGLQNPFFFGFIWFGCFVDRPLKLIDAVHGMPAVLLAILYVNGQGVVELWIEVILQFQYLLYIGAAIWVLWSFRKRLHSSVRNPRSATLQWLSAMVGISLLAHSFALFRNQIATVLAPASIGWLQLAAAGLVLLITLWIAFRALLSPDLFRGVDKAMATAARDMAGRDPTLCDPGDSAPLGELHQYLVTQRAFLDPDLGAARLARQMGWTQKMLSEEINQRSGMHFFDFLNSYRINHAKGLLLDDQNRQITEVMLASGFNSKSSFYIAFRKETGMTPSAYRKHTEGAESS